MVLSKETERLLLSDSEEVTELSIHCWGMFQLSYGNSFLPRLTNALRSNTHVRFLTLDISALPESADLSTPSLIVQTLPLQKIDLLGVRGATRLQQLTMLLEAVSKSSSIESVELRSSQLSPNVSHRQDMGCELVVPDGEPDTITAHASLCRLALHAWPTRVYNRARFLLGVSIMRSIWSHPGFKEIKLYSTYDEAFLQQIAKFLRDSTAPLQAVTFHGWTISTEDFSQFASALQTRDGLQKVCFEDCRFSEEAASVVRSIFQNGKKELCIHGESDGLSFSSLMSLSGLEKLDLSSAVIAENLISRTSAALVLESSRLRSISLPPFSFRHACELLYEFSPIQEVSLNSVRP